MTRVNFLNSWLGSWYRDYPIEKNNKTQLSINLILKDKIEKQSTKKQKKKVAINIIKTIFKIYIKKNREEKLQF